MVEVGAAGQASLFHLSRLGWLPLDRLFKAHNYDELGGTDVFLLYAEGWLIVRYIFDHPDRQRADQRYLRLINNGTPFDEAARQAIPDLAAFNSRAVRLCRPGPLQRRAPAVPDDRRRPDHGRTLRPAEQALLADEIKLSQGYAQREASDFANHVRDTAARFPDDPFAIRMVMETQYLAGNNDGGAGGGGPAARDRAGQCPRARHQGPDPDRRLRAAGTQRRGGVAAARQFLVRAVNAAPTDPVVLDRLLSTASSCRGCMPPEAAQSALYSAMEFAPSDGELRYELARDFEQRHMIPEAIAIIRPEAYQVPHRGNESEGERRRREAREIRERQAGRDHHESALEMLTRLEAACRPADLASAAH